MASLLVWGGANYLLIGPKIGERVVRADYLPACEINLRQMVKQQGKDRLAGLNLPSADPARELAARQLERFSNSPAMEGLRRMSRGMGDLFGLDGMAGDLGALYRRQAAEARQAYQDAKRRIEAETKTRLGEAGDVCGCIADKAIGETRSDWALFTGSLTAYRPASIASFGQKMAEVQRAGACTGKAGGS
ncbi:hypothetical protein GN330_12170 [Nitratireductor sp. CAU 1489]|uniref:Uncharacterized protein n=1 Tax=Nitratireductor arenosus TaxID=2682096 RepID=A0A844QJ59_9HYPH|nr:hypothetical protein [Nitratireductor arenosus]MVA98000.1 hypothetical protein [Nitratireductor arenosus]